MAMRKIGSARGPRKGGPPRKGGLAGYFKRSQWAVSAAGGRPRKKP